MEFVAKREKHLNMG